MLNILSAPQSDKIPPNLPIPHSMNENTASQNLLIMYYPKILKHTTQVNNEYESVQLLIVALVV